MKRTTVFTRVGCTVSLSLALVTIVAGTPAAATELVYFPLNPSFGGSPLNGQVLLNSALATNKHTNPDVGEDLLGAGQPSPLEVFQETLERSILGRLASSATSRVVDDEGKLIPGTLETENFTINIVDIGGGLLAITTTDRITGGSTTFQVGK